MNQLEKVFKGTNIKALDTSFTSSKTTKGVGMDDKRKSGDIHEMPLTSFDELSLNGLGVLAYLRSNPYGAVNLVDLEEKFFDQRESLKEGLEELETFGFITTTISLELPTDGGDW